MRIKRHKAVRKTLKFFQVNFGFREPYKVLVDGNFIHAVLSTGNGDVEGTLSKLLMGNVRAFTTRFTLHELQGMGREYRATLESARRLERHKGADENGAKSAAESIKNEIGSSNEQHFFVATQDKDLQKHLSRVSAVPIIFKTVNGISLQKPGFYLQKSVDKASEAKMGIQKYEKASSVMRAFNEDIRRDLGSLRRKKKAKGPNPLAAKKRVKKEAGPGRNEQGGGARDATEAKPKRKRQRNRAAKVGQAPAAEPKDTNHNSAAAGGGGDDEN
jgi:U3 small nucleolar RNA-associated protein 23